MCAVSLTIKGEILKMTKNEETKKTRSVNVKKLTTAAILTAAAVALSWLSFPVGASKCSPVQHMVNVFCAVLLGPGYGVASAFIASLLRNLLALGTPMAFPGSMIGALLSGLLYRVTKKPWPALCLAIAGEVFGTAVLGGLCAYPVAIFLMGKSAGETAFYAYIIPFLISTAGGSAISGVIIAALQRAGVLAKVKKSLE